MWKRRGGLSLAETFGVTDPDRRLAEVRMALVGDPYTPASRWGLSSLKIFKPRLSVKTWMGWRPKDRLVPVTNLFNRTPTPIEEGWSVRKTQVTDFRGQSLTYDSHNGTDFAIPPGTQVTAPAPGVVCRVSDEFHRGGLKVVIDHGRGLITMSNHLGRALVEVGDEVERGHVVALAAYSGIDGVVAFPWSVPHVHFNTWLNGVPVDPFARDGEVSLWRVRNDPKPFRGGRGGDGEIAEEITDEDGGPTVFDEEALWRVIRGCRDGELRRALEETEPVYRRGVDTVFMMNYFPTRFEVREVVYGERFEREGRLDLPFRVVDYDGVRLL